MKTIVILISGRGSNMLSILDAVDSGEIQARIAAVISNRPDAKGLLAAQARGIATGVVNHKEFEAREGFDAAMSQAIDAYAPDLVLLAGFMRILTEDFVNRYQGRLMNIHPSLLPSFPGLHTHQSALEAGVRLHGCTVHFVTPLLDHGPIVIQAAVPVYGDDDEESLAARVIVQEHKIYPLAVRWFVEERLVLIGDRVALSDVKQDAAALIFPSQLIGSDDRRKAP